VPRVVRFQRLASAERASDEALVLLALHDRQAFGLLYDRYVDPIYRYCHGRLGAREDAEDATSLIFARALAALPTQRGISFRSWLFAIAHNVVLNTRRDGVNDRSLEVALEVLDPGPTVEDRASDADRRHAVRHAVAQLPEEQRRVVELRLAGLSGPEVASALGRSHDSVRTTQRRALAALRVRLGVARDAEGRHVS
jgi:RNA polymerase sigma factor (sigma-70 family)